MIYKDMEWADGAIQMPGIRQYVYAVRKNDIVTWPTLPTTGADMGVLATYVGKFVLAGAPAAVKWQKIGILVDDSPVESKTQGSKPSKSFMNQATFMHPGVQEQAVGFAKQANNDDLVFLIQQKDGKFRVIGNEMYQTDVEIEVTLGGAPTDKMGTKLIAKVTDMMPPPFYTGEIVTEDGTINPTVGG